MYPEQITKEMFDSVLDKLNEAFTYNTFTKAVVKDFRIIINNLFMLNIARNPKIIVSVLDKLVHLLRTVDTNHIGKNIRNRFNFQPGQLYF